MFYATIADVERLMAHFTLSSTTKPTDAQVESIIDDTEQEINVALSKQNILIPVVLPTFFTSWLGLVTSYGATAAVLKSMFPSATGPAETPAYAFWESRYKMALKGIIEGSLIPTEVYANSSSGGRLLASTYFTRNPEVDELLGEVATPFFTRDKRW